MQDASRSVSLIRDIIDLVKELNTVVRASAKRHALFEKIRHELLTDEENYPALASSLSLRPLCPTRWTVRAKSLASVADNYDAVLATLDAIAMEDKTESGSKANGLSKSFTRFATYFALKLGILVFQQAEQLSCLLQRKTLTAVAAKRAAEVLITSLQSIRNDKSFELFWSTTQSASHTAGVLPPELPRARKVPARFASGSENVTFVKPEDYFQSVYYNFIDCAAWCVQDKFEQRSFAVYTNAEKLLLDMFSGKNPDDSTADLQAVLDHLDGDVDVKRLTIQLSMLSSLSSGYQPNSVKDVIDKLQNMGAAREMFTEVCKLIRLLLTIPVSIVQRQKVHSRLPV